MMSLGNLIQPLTLEVIMSKFIKAIFTVRTESAAKNTEAAFIWGL
jgi:hypothetical protein